MTYSDHFSSLSRQYAAYRPNYPNELFTWLADIAPKSGIVWDCACGSGQASEGLAKVFNHVLATDASEAQIASAKPNPKIDYRVALADSSGLSDHSVGLITVAQAAHWFHFDRFYDEVRRVMMPRGILALWTYEFFTIDDAKIQSCIQDFYENTMGPYWPPERHFVKEHYRTLPFPFPNQIAAPAFHQDFAWNLEQILGYFRSWSAVKKYMEANERDPVATLESILAPLWGDPAKARSISMPIYMCVAKI